MKKIIWFVIKELIQFRRDKKVVAVVLMAPVIQLILLGYAANMDVKKIDTIVMDLDNSTLSRKYISSLQSNGYFIISGYTRNYEELGKSISTGKSLIGIVIPKDFMQKIYRNEQPKVQVILDGSNGNKSSIVLGYLFNVTTGFYKHLIAEELVSVSKKGYFRYSGISPEIRVWYNPEMETRRFLLPGIVALLLLIIAIPLTAMAVVREKESGTIEQILVSPLKPYQIIAGKLIPFLIIGFIDFVFVLLVMRFWFGIQIRGSVLLLFATAFLFEFSNLGIGLFISTSSKSQQQAVIVSVFGVIVPMIYLSGFVFPIENMPKIIQPITYLIPLRYFLVILRGIVLKGIGFVELWVQILILLGFGVITFVISSTRFRKVLQ